MVNIGLIPQTYVSSHFAVLLPWLARSLAYSLGEEHPMDLIDKGMWGSMQFWGISTSENVLIGLATTEFISYSRMKRLRVVTVSGEHFDEWAEALFERLKQYAGHFGASGIEYCGRPGFTRKLARLGFHSAYIVGICDFSGRVYPKYPARHLEATS